MPYGTRPINASVDLGCVPHAIRNAASTHSYMLRIGAREGDASDIKQHARASTNLIFPRTGNLR